MSSKSSTVTIPAHLADAFQAILAANGVEAKPAKAKAKKARKTTNRKAAGTTIEGKTCLTSKNRARFIADHDWATNGSSVRDLCLAVAAGAELVGNWAIGPRNAERFGVATKKAKKSAKKKATKAEVVEVVEPVKAKTFRRANGTTAPKGEWAIREVLEAQGLSRTEVDEKTAAVLAVL